ncbi:hypothetical protein Tco_0104925 [Tanacetum coccineum]
MLVPRGKGSANPAKPHHAPSDQYESPPQEDKTTPQKPLQQEITIPSQSHSDIPTPRRLTRGTTQISQSKVPSPGADETASPTRDDRHGEAFPTATSLDTGMQQKVQEMMDMCTNLQHQHLLMEQRIQTQGDDLLDGDTVKDSNKSADKGSDSTNDTANVLSTLGATNILASGGLRSVFTTASLSVATASTVVSPVVATASGRFPTTAIFTTASVATLRVSRSPKGIVIESSPLISINIPSISKEDKGKGIMTEPKQPSKEKENEMVAKYLSEYEQAEAELSHDEKVKLINELLEYQRNLAQIKKCQVKDFKGMTFEQIEEKFIPVWEKIQNFVPMNSKLESERLKRSGIQLDKERVKKLKIAEVSVEKKDSDDHDKIINLQQWAVLIFRVGQAPESYPYFFSMLKEFDRKDVVALWKLVKDRFKTELSKSDPKKCLFWPLKVMFKPVASDGLWQYQTPIKDWKMYSSCRVHCLSMEGMVNYMLDNVEYPLPKSTLQRMLDQKCEVSEFNEELIHMINLIRGSFPLLEYFPTASEVYSTVSESFPLLMFPLLEARAEGKELDEEHADLGVADDQVAQTITHNVVFQTYDLDAYDSSYDDISSAKPVLMANLSGCDSDFLSEWIKPILYDGNVLSKTHDALFVVDDEETLILAEESRLKMVEKQNDPIMKKEKINITPINYSELNKLAEDFGKRFVSQQELSAEQIHSEVFREDKLKGA